MRFRRGAGSGRRRARYSPSSARTVEGRTPMLVTASPMLDLVKEAVDAGVTHAHQESLLGFIPGEAGQRRLDLFELEALVKADDRPDLEQFLISDSVLRGLRKPDQIGRIEKLFAVARIEPHHLTPVVMTAAASLALRPGEAAPWLNRATSAHHDTRSLPPLDKAGIMIGVGLPAPGQVTVHPTDREGWVELSNVEAVSHSYKYDALLLRLSTSSGPTCFLVPIRDDAGAANRLAIKDRFERPGTQDGAFLRVALERAAAFQVGPAGAGDQLFAPVVRRLRADTAVIGAAQMAAATEMLASGIDRRRNTDIWYRRFVEEISVCVAKDMAFDASDRLGTPVGDTALAIAQHWVRTRFGRVVPDAAASTQLEELPVVPAIAWTSSLLPLWGGDARTTEVSFDAAVDRGGLDPFLAGLHLRSDSASLEDAWSWLCERAADKAAPVGERVAATSLAWAGSLLSQRGRRDALAVLLADDVLRARSGRREGTVVIDLRTPQSEERASTPSETAAP